MSKDEQGAFLTCHEGRFLRDFDPKMVEVIAFPEALSSLKDKNMAKVTFELDSLVVVQAMRHTGKDLSFLCGYYSVSSRIWVLYN